MPKMNFLFKILFMSSLLYPLFSSLKNFLPWKANSARAPTPADVF